jgi:hypothetical protein
VSDVPVGEPNKRLPSATVVRPVPPPVVFKVPVVDGVIVNVVPEFVMVLPRVNPLNDCVEVANVIAPVCAEPNDCWNERTPLLVIVTAPVAPETEIPVPATFEVTPVFVTLPPEYAKPDEKVVVATPVQPPLMNARTWPAEPVYSDDVETAVGTPAAPVELARTELAAIDARPMVAFEPPIWKPSDPEVTERPVPTASVEVATD